MRETCHILEWGPVCQENDDSWKILQKQYVHIHHICCICCVRIFSAVLWEAAFQNQQKKKKKKQQTLEYTDRRCSTRQSINTQRSKQRGIKKMGKAEVNPPCYGEGTGRHTNTAYTAQLNWTRWCGRRRRVWLLITLCYLRCGFSNWWCDWELLGAMRHPLTKTLSSLVVTNSPVANLKVLYMIFSATRCHTRARASQTKTNGRMATPPF